MATKTAILAVRVVTDAEQAQKGLNETSRSVDGFGDSMSKLAGPAAIALGAITALAVKSVDAASQLQQATGAVESVFGAYAGEVKNFAQDAADNVGLAESQYSNLAAVIGAQLKNMGVPMEDVAGQTNELIDLGADLAATFGGTTADAVEALSSLLRGERDPIERYGVSIKQAAIDAQKAEMGLAGLTGEADTQATTMATLALLYDQTADAQGQFARESDTLAGAQQRATAKWEDAQAALGEALLPALSEAADVASTLADIISENPALFQTFITVLAIAAAAILAVTAAQWLWNIAMAANPIGLIIIAIGLVIAIIAVLIINWETVEQVAADVWGAVIGWIQDVGKWFQTIFESIGNWWNDLVADWRRGFDDLFGWINDAIGWFGSLVGASNSAPTSGGGGVRSSSPSLYRSVPGAPMMGHVGAPRARAATRATGPTIIIQGAIDPDGTAQQIRRILRHDDRRIGFTAAAGGRY